MAGYLEAYGLEEEHRARRNRLIKIGALIAIVAIIVALIFYMAFKNFHETSEAKQFLSLLKNQQYQDAYQMWGCTEASPCQNYPFPKFLEDWGPKSPHANASSATIGDVESCGSGVIVTIKYANAADNVPLWVERNTDVLSFSPWPECLGKQWRFKSFFKRLFGGK